MDLYANSREFSGYFFSHSKKVRVEKVNEHESTKQAEPENGDGSRSSITLVTSCLFMYNILSSREGSFGQPPIKWQLAMCGDDERFITAFTLETLKFISLAFFVTYHSA